ncbi:MAG: hypothetical protein R2807_05375 [Chitinophagales bacterium]
MNDFLNTVTTISNDYEFIFINDGSNDSSLNKIKEFAAHNPQ